MAVLTRMDAKKFPTLAQLVGDDRPKRIMTTSEIQAAFAAARGEV